MLNISDPENPNEVGSCDTPGDVDGIEIIGDFAYTFEDNDGISIIDISNPEQLDAIGHHNTPGRAHGIDVHDDYAYVADYDGGLRIIDIGDPDSPEEVADIYTGNAKGVKVVGDHVFVANHERLFSIVDVTDLENLEIIGLYECQGSLNNDLFVTEEYAYILESHNGLLIIDIRDPTEPAEAGSIRPCGYIRDVTVIDDYAYTADFGNGARIVNIANPGNPARISVPVHRNKSLKIGLQQHLMKIAGIEEAEL